MLTDTGQQHAALGLPINPGQGKRPRKITMGLRDRAWWELRNKGAASLHQITSTHANGSEKAADMNLYKYLIALEMAGILVRHEKRIPAKQGRGRVQWRMKRDLGIKAPVWRQKEREIYDPNSGAVFPMTPVSTGEDES